VNVLDFAQSGVRAVYEFPENRVAELRRELNEPDAFEFGPLLLSRQDPKFDAVWAHNIWSEVKVSKISSISTAANELRPLRRKWHRAYAPEDLFRRSSLIESELPRWKRPILKFPGEVPPADWGSWTLLDKDWLLFGAQNSSPFLSGIAKFEELSDEILIKPPSQAYKKIWEGLSLVGRWPQKGEVCVDLGSSPGGWTWALLELGAEVHSVDRSELDPNLARYPLISQRPFFYRSDAFKFRTELVKKKVDWVFSDVICYPERLKEFMETWGKLEPRPNLMFTLKFQGETDFSTIEHFRNYPGSFLRHLSVNKHEITWIWLNKDRV
jgi:23S rRNA (cytidine2498-2'-O)-methyltransferase